MACGLRSGAGLEDVHLPTIKFMIQKGTQTICTFYGETASNCREFTRAIRGTEELLAIYKGDTSKSYLITII